jgi:deoxyribonuclease V
MASKDRGNARAGTAGHPSGARGRHPAIGRWDVTVSEAVAQQRELRSQLVAHPPAGFAPRYVAGADVSLNRDSPRGYAGIAVIDRTTMDTVDEATAVADVAFPYVPGLLSFRELPLFELAWEGLRRRPDVLLFDGQGYAHPRRFGLACHGGVLFDVPSIGCAKTRLLGEHPDLPDEAGAVVPLEHRGEEVGAVVRLKARTKPLYVSPGHRMDVATAVRVVLGMGRGYREPETTRAAHRAVNAARKAGEM